MVSLASQVKTVAASAARSDSFPTRPAPEQALGVARVDLAGTDGSQADQQVGDDSSWRSSRGSNVRSRRCRRREDELPW